MAHFCWRPRKKREVYSTAKLNYSNYSILLDILLIIMCKSKLEIITKPYISNTYAKVSASKHLEYDLYAQ